MARPTPLQSAVGPWQKTAKPCPSATPTAADPAYATCQYKVLFDKNLKARNSYWLSASCADRLNAPAK